MGRERREEADILGDEHSLSRVGNQQRADDHAVRAQRNRGGRRRLKARDNLRRLGTRVAHQLEMLTPRRPGQQPLVIPRNFSAAERAQGSFRRGYLEWISGGLADQRKQCTLRIEEANGVPHDLLDNPVQLE